MFNKCFSLFIVIFLLFLNSDPVNAQLIEKKEYRLRNTHNRELFFSELKNLNKPLITKTSHKSLLLAGSLSFIVPGAALGQFYKEEYINGGIRLGISVLSFIWLVVSSPHTLSDGGSADQKIIALGIYVINWIASVVDAFIPTKINDKAKYRKYKLSF